MKLNKLIVLVGLFTGCSTLGIGSSCYKGLGMDFGQPSMYIYKVFIDSPAHKAGVLPGGTILNTDNWPPSGEVGTIHELVVRYGNKSKTFKIVQDSFCTNKGAVHSKKETHEWKD